MEHWSLQLSRALCIKSLAKLRGAKPAETEYGMLPGIILTLFKCAYFL